MTSHTTSTGVLRWAAAVCVLAVLTFAGGCSSKASKFESQWKTASAQFDRWEVEQRQQEQRQPQPAQATRRELVIEGPWEGRWRSSANSHSGALRCVLTRTGPDTYEAQYHATYFWIFRYAYSMPLRVDRRDEAYNVVYFDGETNLGGIGGGRYRYTGYASADEFKCTYRAGWDYGYFELARPGLSAVMAQAQ